MLMPTKSTEELVARTPSAREVNIDTSRRDRSLILIPYLLDLVLLFPEIFVHSLLLFCSNPFTTAPIGYRQLWSSMKLLKLPLFQE